MRELVKLRRAASASALVLGVVEEWMRKANAPLPLIMKVEASKENLLDAIQKSFKPKEKKKQVSASPDLCFVLLVRASIRSSGRSSTRRPR